MQLATTRFTATLLTLLLAGTAASAADPFEDLELVDVSPSVVMAENPNGSNLTCIALDGSEGFAEGEVTEPAFIVPRWVFNAASPPDRISTWTVQIRRIEADGQAIDLSPPSEPRTYYWR